MEKGVYFLDLSLIRKTTASTIHVSEVTNMIKIYDIHGKS